MIRMRMGNDDGGFLAICRLAEPRYWRERHVFTQRNIQRSPKVKDQAALAGNQFDAVSTDLMRASVNAQTDSVTHNG